MRAANLSSEFWAKVKRQDGCWPWQGTMHVEGYGVVCIDGRTRKAHRVALALSQGIDLPPPNVLCCHSCDNPPCCNPAHLRWGSNAENIAERDAKGRHEKLRNTHCPQGHPYSGDNLKIRPRDGVRVCRTCSNDRAREYQRRKRALLTPSPPLPQAGAN